MRLYAGLCLAAASTVVAAPQKDDLPPGAISRLTPARSEPRVGEVTTLLYLGENTLFIGTNGGWTTWDLQKKQPLQVRPVGGPTFAVARDSERVFVGSARKLHAIEPIESAMAEPARSWESAVDGLAALAVAPGGRRVVFAADNLRLSVLDPKTGNVTGAAELPATPMAAAMTANGRVLAVVTRDGAARTYTLAANGSIEPLWLKRVARSERNAVQFSPDGRLVALSSAGRIAVLESVTGRPLITLERKFGEGDVRGLAFSQDGRQIAVVSGGPDPVVRVWAVDSGSEQASYRGHRGDLNAVAFAPDGKSLASAGSDQLVLLWKAPPTPAASKVMIVADAWDTLDSLDSGVAYRSMGAMLDDHRQATETIRKGFAGMAAEQARINRWIAELAHDEFRTREAARRSLLKAGLRASAALTDPGRKKLDAEGEQRVRFILESFESQGLRIPESGLYGEPLRSVRGVRVLETIGGKDARAVLEQAAWGPADERLTKEAKLALEVFPIADR